MSDAKRQKIAADAELQAFIDGVNSGYEAVHCAFEHQFWGTKMALSAAAPGGGSYSTAELTRTKAEMEAFLADKDRLATTREWVKKDVGSAEQRKVLAIFAKTFGCYIMEGELALELRHKATALEGSLEDARNKMALGYAEPQGGAFVPMSSVGLRNLLRASEVEATRKAAFEGLRSIGPFVLDGGFPQLVRTRNALARSLGYSDFYDYKVTRPEGVVEV